VNVYELCRIWGSHSASYEEHYLLGYNTMQFAESRATFRRNIAFIFRVEVATHFRVDALLGLFDPEGGDVSRKRRLTFNGLHGVISQKIVFFVRVYELVLTNLASNVFIQRRNLLPLKCVGLP
jgi:hypothetical protein